MALDGMAVAVTGATGFLGRYIVDALLGRGARVIGAVRDPGKVPSLAARGVEMRRCDLADRASLEAAFRGVDAVVSNAALFVIGNLSWEAHRKANVLGAENVARAAADAGVRRLVHVSSTAVYRDRHRGPIDEDHPQLRESDRRPGNAYPVSKALSEQRVWEVAAELGLELTVARPSGIYGAFDPNITPLLRRALAGPIAVVPAFARFPLVYAGDVAEGIAATLHTPSSVGRAYNLSGPAAPVSDLVEGYRRAGGRVAAIALPLPVPFRMVVDIRRAEAELGFRNRGYEEAFRDTFAREG